MYALTSPAVALELAQNWAPRPDTVFFYTDRFFVVVHWRSAGQKALQPFTSALMKRFKTR